MENLKIKLLVTGATGFIGQSLCKKLQGSEYCIRALARESSDSSKLERNSSNIEVVFGELSDKESLGHACKNIDIVIHLAGIAHVNNVASNAFQQTIYDGSKNLFDSAIANKVKKIVFLSSVLAEAAENFDDEVTAYGQAKYNAEVYLKNACANSATDYLILRPVNVYGPDMKGNIMSMVRWIRKGILPSLPNVTTKISLISVNDLVELVELSLIHPKAENKCFTVSESTPYELLEIEKAIYQALEKKIPTSHTPRMLLYAAAGASGLIAKMLEIFGLRPPWGGINLRTYRNLISDSVYTSESLCSELGFIPSRNFYDELPSIVEKT
ncbi:MAG: NAD-dependent epimerase/dehydratase family protein [Pseudomonadales bacterium]|nr:NAD-dependent epimerase/dehydratase family protein [Pseudomonadales bacterium]